MDRQRQALQLQKNKPKKAKAPSEETDSIESLSESKNSSSGSRSSDSSESSGQSLSSGSSSQPSSSGTSQKQIESSDLSSKELKQSKTQKNVGGSSSSEIYMGSQKSSESGLSESPNSSSHSSDSDDSDSSDGSESSGSGSEVSNTSSSQEDSESNSSQSEFSSDSESDNSFSDSEDSVEDQEGESESSKELDDIKKEKIIQATQKRSFLQIRADEPGKWEWRNTQEFKPEQIKNFSGDNEISLLHFLQRVSISEQITKKFRVKDINNFVDNQKAIDPEINEQILVKNKLDEIQDQQRDSINKFFNFVKKSANFKRFLCAVIAKTKPELLEYCERQERQNPQIEIGLFKCLLPFVLIMFCVKTQEIDFFFQEFAETIMPSLKSRIKSKVTEDDFKDLQEYLEGSFMLNKKEISQRLKLFKEPIIKRSLQANGNKKQTEGYRKVIFELFDSLPFIMTALVSYIIEQIDRRHVFFQDMLDRPGFDSLQGSFAKAGLEHSQFKKKVITFSMTEHAILIFNRKGGLNIEQLELVLRQVKDKMRVSEMDRLEKTQQRLESKNPRKSFGRWLLQKISLQHMYFQIMDKTKQQILATGTLPHSRAQFAQKLVMEEKIWEVVANIEKINISRVCRHVSKNLAILLHVKNNFGSMLSSDLAIKKGLRKWIRLEVKKEFKKLEDLKKKLQDKKKIQIFRIKTSIVDQNFENKFNPEHLKNDKLNLKLKQAFKKSIREGGNEFDVRDALKEAYRKYWVELQQSEHDEKRNLKITVDDTRMLYDHALQNLFSMEELQHFLRYGLRIFKRSLYIVQEKENPLFILSKQQQRLKQQQGQTPLYILANKQVAGKSSKNQLNGPSYKRSADAQFTVHDLNEAIFFTFKDYCSFLKFSMVEMATYYFIIEQVSAETASTTKNAKEYIPGKHTNFMFVLPLPIDSQALKKDNQMGLISSMLEPTSLQRIKAGEFGHFDQSRDEFKWLKFQTFDMTHFAMQILMDEGLRKISEFMSTKVMTNMRHGKSAQDQKIKPRELFKKSMPRPHLQLNLKFLKRREKHYSDELKELKKNVSKDKQNRLFYFVQHLEVFLTEQDNRVKQQRRAGVFTEDQYFNQMIKTDQVEEEEKKNDIINSLLAAKLIMNVQHKEAKQNYQIITEKKERESDDNLSQEDDEKIPLPLYEIQKATTPYNIAKKVTPYEPSTIFDLLEVNENEINKFEQETKEANRRKENAAKKAKNLKGAPIQLRIQPKFEEQEEEEEFQSLSFNSSQSFQGP